MLLDDLSMNFQGRSESISPMISGGIVGILDHHKTWRFTLRATPEQCVRGFSSVFDGTRSGGPLITRAKWSVKPSRSSATAVYRGRGGIIGFATLFTQRGSNEQDSAIGSEVKFEAKAEGDGTTVCHMWLSSSATNLGFTSDARFLRPYMQRVQHSLAEIDPNLSVQRT